MASEVTCTHGRQFGECFTCMMAVAGLEPVCPECGNDIVAEGQELCSDCLWESEGPHQGK